MLKIKKLIHDLPEHNFETFRYIAEHLNKVSEKGDLNKVCVCVCVCARVRECLFYKYNKAAGRSVTFVSLKLDTGNKMSTFKINTK